MSKLTTSQKEQLEKLVLTATVQRFIMAELQRHVQLTNSLYELYRLLPAIATVKFDTGINSDSLPHLSIRQGKDDDHDGNDIVPPAPGSFAYDNWCYRHNPNHPHACACQRKF